MGNAVNRYLALLGCLVAAFALFYVSVRTPSPAPTDASAKSFSTRRALADIAALAPVPHPIGSDANHRVRDGVLQRMTALGLSPRLQRSVGLEQLTISHETWAAAGPVENVIGLLPGRDHGLPALALMAHYDSVPGSPGAADDMAGVASTLEIVRALEAGGTPERDVMVVITDGEEAGLLGAHAFFGQDPAAAHVGFIMNFETRGGGGRAAMFETGANNGGSIDLYRRTAVRPDSNSLAVFVYKTMPNDTDFTVAKAAGKTGFNYAFIGRQFDYHSPSSTPAALDQGAVRHMGEQALPTARALAFSRTLPGPAPDAAYGDLFGLAVLAYPAWAGWIVLAAAGGLIALALVQARRTGVAKTGSITRGLGGGLLILVGAALALHLARRVTGVEPGWISYRAILARFPVFEAGMALAGLSAVLLVLFGMARSGGRLAGAALALVLGLAGSAFLGFDPLGLGLGVVAAVLAVLVLGETAEPARTWIGGLVLAWLAALAAQVAAPTTGPVIAWPLLIASMTAAATGAATRKAAWTLALVAVAAVVSVAWLGVLFHTLLQGLDLPEAPALAVWLAALSLWPLAWPENAEHRWAVLPPIATLALGLAIMLFLHLTSPWTARYPRAVEPQYLVEAGTGRAWRIAAIPPDPWTRGVLRADGGAIARHAFLGLMRPVASAAAKPADAPPPSFSLQRTPDGLATLHVVPATGGDRLVLTVSTDAPIADARIAGQTANILRRHGQLSRIVWDGSDQPFDIVLRPLRRGALDLAYAQQFPRWPAQAKPLPAPPATDMAWDEAGATLVVGRRRLAW